MEHEPGSYTIQGPDWWEKYWQVMLFLNDDQLIWMMMMMMMMNDDDDVENYQWWMMDDPILYPLDAHLPAPLPNLFFSSNPTWISQPLPTMQTKLLKIYKKIRVLTWSLSTLSCSRFSSSESSQHGVKKSNFWYLTWMSWKQKCFTLWKHK